MNKTEQRKQLNRKLRAMEGQAAVIHEGRRAWRKALVGDAEYRGLANLHCET